MYFLLFKTDAGLRVRAVTQNRGMAACLGVRSRRVDALTFALGAGLAGIAGCALTQIGNVGPELGQNYIVDSFMVVVTGASASSSAPSWPRSASAGSTRSSSRASAPCSGRSRSSWS